MCLGVPGFIVSIEGEGMYRQGRVRFAGIVRDVNLAFVPEAGIGDYVIVHVGVAISKIDETEAQKVFSYLNGMGNDEISG